jgi:hypothetical protein
MGRLGLRWHHPKRNGEDVMNDLPGDSPQKSHLQFGAGLGEANSLKRMAPQVGLETACKRQSKDLASTAGKS